ncbi:TetR family transcriptional regulator [Vibrio sp. 10N.286.49.B3]|uniref:TetR/AcrR family transcriptional regulator n=1 Tax=Vibrio sp. 10N.286.49.B3 TaxID=1880855 RepID=UPI000C830AEB|nr:TetR/AcrR family transcriptional regulator [Vibrio sp. 10N.286.49.B3]PMH46898.1 TetR family transcriptional regulator [Vibrio sp. 10N.286.49.B3]
MTRKNKTKEKILDVAESLFAERGFNDTSLRAITSKANVNLASVNYHFGDKKSLVRAVLNRYLESFMPNVQQSLLSLDKKESVEMVEVFESLRSPLVSLNSLRPNGTNRFMLLIGRGYTDVQGHLRWFISAHYSEVLNLFTKSVLKANPYLTPELLFWRLHFTLGACVFTMASSKALVDMVENDFSQKVHIESVIDQIIPYLAAGVTAKTPQVLVNE